MHWLRCLSIATPARPTPPWIGPGAGWRCCRTAHRTAECPHRTSVARSTTSTGTHSAHSLDHCPKPPDHLGATNPTGPAAMHTDSAAVFARTLTASPAPDSRTKTRLSPGCTGTFVSLPSDSDIVIEPSLFAR